MTLAIIKADKYGKFHDELISSIQDNQEGISEIIYTGSEEDINFEDIQVPVKFLNVDSENKAFLRNKVIEESNGDYILWISNSCELDFDFVPEISEVVEEDETVDIVYPKQVLIDIYGSENIYKYYDISNKEMDIIKVLKPEKILPEWGILTRKDIFDRFGKFDEEFEDYEFYYFILQNLKNLKIRHAKFSFIINKHTDTFIDTSYRSFALRRSLPLYDLKEIFPHLNWENEELAISTAYYLIGEVLSEYYDLFNASEYFRKSAISFHNKLSVQRLVNTYYNMGLFEQAMQLLRDDQGFEKEEIENQTSHIRQISELIDNIEKSIQEGKLQEITNILNDVYQIYQGAPVVNIMGFIEYIRGNKEDAFKLFYKTVTLNPINEDYIMNLIDVSKELGKEEKVKGLINRLIGNIQNS